MSKNIIEKKQTNDVTTAQDDSTSSGGRMYL